MRHMHLDLKADDVHRTQYAAVAGTREADRAASIQYLFDRVLRKYLPQQRLEKPLAEDLIQLREVRLLQSWHGHRIQRHVVREQYALAALDAQ